MSIDSEDDFCFIDEESPEATKVIEVMPWMILVVDDVQDIHDVTDLALKAVIINGKPLYCLHAYSGKEAVDIVSSRADIDLMLLDAVMETENAGFDCAKYIKYELKRSIPIIVMRTGQAGIHNILDIREHPALDDILYKSQCTIKVLNDMLRKWLK